MEFELKIFVAVGVVLVVKKVFFKKPVISIRKEIEELKAIMKRRKIKVVEEKPELIPLNTVMENLIKNVKQGVRADVRRVSKNLLKAYNDMEAAKTDRDIRLAKEYLGCSCEELLTLLNKSSPDCLERGVEMLDEFVTTCLSLKEA